MQCTTSVAALRALVAGSVDYAGLFPPAKLELEPALNNYAEYLRSADSWMLGAFVLPVDQFAAAERHAELFDSEHSLRVSALGRKTESPAEFTAALAAHAHAISAWNQRRAVVQQFEMPLPPQFDEQLFVAIRSLLGSLKLQAFWEPPADDAAATIAAISRHNATRPGEPFGYKLRTGGVVASAFPDTAKVARALVSAATSSVPIKFTAGLHHPVRLFHSSVETKMHGFLNVLGAGVLAAEHGWDEQQTIAMLEDESATSFRFDNNGFAWREWQIATDRITMHRAIITSFGSCSFDEPREDLRALELL